MQYNVVDRAALPDARDNTVGSKEQSLKGRGRFLEGAGNMKFCIDDANVEMIRRIYEYYPVDGVSTNPSILARTGRDPYEVLKENRHLFEVEVCEESLAIMEKIKNEL